MNSTRTFDAIVVLGAAVWPNQQPSPTLTRRTLHAVQKYKLGVAPLIIGSGGMGKNPPSEAEMITRICIDAGVPQSALLREDQSTSTLENVLFTGQILAQNNAKSILVVTDKYHLPRTLMTFRALGIDCAGSGPPRGVSKTPLRKWLWSYVRELAALPYYFVKTKADPRFRS